MKRLTPLALSFGLFWTLGYLAVGAQQATRAPAKATASTRAKLPKKDFPPYTDVIKGYEKVVSTADGKPSLYTIWTRKKDNQMLAELPRAYTKQKHFIALTVASGESFAGLQAGDLYAYWKRYDKRLALIEPNVSTRSTGDAESKSSVKRLFTDRVILDVPILTVNPRGGTPVIDMDALLVGQASRFFGPRVRVTNPRLITIKKAKAFPQNVELAFEVPMAESYSFFSFRSSSRGGGRLKTLHYSISLIPGRTGYVPRKADQRVGYFTTAYNDLGQFKEDGTWVRYINRWQLKKRDTKLKLSPPVTPIRFYIEHTTPVRYRRWVRQGILYWNKAFEKVGLYNAIEVVQQDAASGTNPGAHMDKDPEDVRYNFVRWLNNDISVAIGPSRVHPVTGEILDADIILTDGWIRYYLQHYKQVLPQIAMEGFGPETLAWLRDHPNWDPRIRLAPPSERAHILAQRARRGVPPQGGHPLASVDPTLIGDDEYDGLVGRNSQINGLCLAATGKAFDIALLRMSLDLLQEKEKDEKDKKKKDEEDKKKEAEDKKKNAQEKKKKAEEEKEQLLDGIPERFVGPLLADLVAHEVGHTLGLRHNFKSSGLYSLKDINSPKAKGKKAFAGSVMDYLPINMNMDDGEVQGDYAMIDIGPYDMWAIEYGYTLEKDLKPILDRVAESGLQYATDEDTWGPDPLARRYDFGADPLDYAKSQMRLAKYHRERLVEKFVKDGESWAKARRGYEMTLFQQVRSLSMMANWLGGAFVHRDKKGDKNARAPIEVVPAQRQRDALEFVINNAFYDKSFGLTPEMLRHMTVDKWLDRGGYFSSFDDATWPVHDRIMGIQASTLTMLMNPATLTLVYDNEFRIPAEEEMISLPELLERISAAIWSELDNKPTERCTARKPWISSLRRNLQREHLERLIDLTMPDAGYGAAYKPISNLATMKLRALQKSISGALDHRGMLDPYSVAHLSEAKLRIEKALDAQYIYNVRDIGGSGFPYFFLLREPEAPNPGK